MRLTATAQVSVDGVMQGPGVTPVEVDVGAFHRRGWAHFDTEAGTVMDEVFERADAFLLGKKTCGTSPRPWGTWDDPGDSPVLLDGVEHACRNACPVSLRTRPGRARSSSATTSRLRFAS